jgi:hypothetical protein
MEHLLMQSVTDRFISILLFLFNHRLSFRCSYKEDQGCLARRRVQQSDADPSVYLITYFGDHTCSSDNNEPPVPLVINFGSSSTRDGQCWNGLRRLHSFHITCVL